MFGMKLTAEGLRVDENKVQYIINMEASKDVRELVIFGHDKLSDKL